MTSEHRQDRNTDSEEVSLKELILKFQEWWRYLSSKLIIILIFGILGGILGFFYGNSKKPVYTATTTFVLEDEKGGGGLGNLAGLASIAGVDLGTGGGGIFQGDNLLELYKSRKMIEKTLLTEVDYQGKKELLIDRYIEINQLREQWGSKGDLLKVNFKTINNRLTDSLINQFVDDINKNYLIVSKLDKKLSIIKVDVKSKDEFFAKNLNDEIVRNVNDFYVKTKTKKSLDNIRILQRQTDSVRAMMNGAIFTAAVVADQTPNLNPTRQVQRLAPVQRSQFSLEINKAALSSLIQNLELSKIALLKETPLIQVVDQPVLPLSKEVVGKIKATIIGVILAVIFGLCLLIVRRVFKGILKD